MLVDLYNNPPNGFLTGFLQEVQSFPSNFTGWTQFSMTVPTINCSKGDACFNYLSTNFVAQACRWVAVAWRGLL